MTCSCLKVMQPRRPYTCVRTEFCCLLACDELVCTWTDEWCCLMAFDCCHKLFLRLEFCLVEADLPWVLDFPNQLVSFARCLACKFRPYRLAASLLDC